MKATKKPITIDYFDPTNDSSLGLGLWIKSFGDDPKDVVTLLNVGENGDIKKGIAIKTLEGTSYEVTDKDVIIRGVKGEYYPCKKDIFEQTYDRL